jgi:RNA polymerase sigma-70 factor (ECF subfamily)
LYFLGDCRDILCTFVKKNVILAFLRLKKKQETDEELLQLFCNTGDTSLFGTLFDRYIPLTYGLCLKYLQNEEDAEDAVMQLFEELLEKVKKHEIKEFRTWLYSVAKNHCLQIIRKKNSQIEIELRPDFMESDEILHLLNEDEENDERLQALKKCLEKLPIHQKNAIKRFFFENFSYADISDSTGYPVNKVKSYIQNGKRNLEICIKKSL